VSTTACREDRDEAYVISIPRNLLVNIPGQGDQRINAAYAAGGPPLVVRTLEQLTGSRIDHLATVHLVRAGTAWPAQRAHRQALRTDTMAAYVKNYPQGDRGRRRDAVGQDRPVLDRAPKPSA
jgi:hypothetical protein